MPSQRGPLPPTTPGDRAARLLLGLAVAAGVLAGVNALIEGLERRGVVETHRPDDAVQFVEEDLFRREGDHWITTDYARQTMVPSRFRAEKGSGWRLFLVGGSFAMGSPYVHQEEDGGWGGIADFVRIALERDRSSGDVAVINAAAGGQDSNRVAAIVGAVARHQPDAVLVATCNNEGALAPSVLRRRLHELGGYRFLTRYLVGDGASSDRSWFTSQHPDLQRLSETFRSNLEASVRAVQQAGAVAMLATLPVNELYTGDVDKGRLGLPPAIDASSLPREVDPCAGLGRNALEAGDPESALAALQACTDVAEERRWRGLALRAQGDLEAARHYLDQSVELRPRNRCRPSFNRIIREVAQEEGALLVDLEAAGRALTPDGLPGYDLFLDTCRMRWRGYLAMAREVLDVLRRADKLPPGTEAAAVSLDEEEFAGALDARGFEEDR